ncbi:MAG: hypothetical protein GX458_01570, partial [Phyllobacteriaceae bacterium]|nr:hypothetical protein [Phyllobacteriaceae bacterium]
MRHTLRCLLTAAALVAGTLPALAEKSFTRDELESGAIRLEKSLEGEAARPGEAAQLRKDADAALAAKNFEALGEIAGRLVLLNPRDWTSWTRLSVAFSGLTPADWQAKNEARRNAHAAAYRAYRLAPGPREEALALTTLANSYVSEE